MASSAPPISIPTGSYLGRSRPRRNNSYKCWVCHNEYTQNGGPRLGNLYQRSMLLSDDPVNDEHVIQKIKNGGPRMPSFRTSLADSDIADLVGYIRGGKCCVEGGNPLQNPWYVADKQKWPVQRELSGGAWGNENVSTGDSSKGIGI